MSGRPSEFTEDVAAAICTRLANGESLRAIATDETMPAKSTVMRWLAANEAFRDQYARAREAQADHFAEEILDIADDGTNDYVDKANKDGSTYEAFDGEHVQRSRLRVDTRKWLMSKMAPKKYGEKITAEHTGQGGGPVALTWLPPQS